MSNLVKNMKNIANFFKIMYNYIGERNDREIRIFRKVKSMER